MKLQIWEITACPDLDSRHIKYLDSFDCVFIVYDTSNPDSFLKVEKLNENISLHMPQNPHKLLVGNKNDLFVLISYEEGKELAGQLKLPFIEVSARTGRNIRYTFFRSISECLSRKNQYYIINYNCSI
jgi:hypothetical protein